MAVSQLYQRQKKVLFEFNFFWEKNQTKVLANQNGFMVLEGVVASAFIMGLMLIFFRVNLHFDKYEKKSIQNFQKEWNKLEAQYGKAK